jgi:23S rRNA pseudouridine1911/1915/1917 synthase
LRTTINTTSTLFDFLISHYPDSPRARIKKLLQSGNIHVNNLPVTLHSFRLNSGDVIEIRKSGTIASKAGAPFPVLYEDPQVIVVDKPAGISTSSIDGSRNVRDELTAFLRDQSKGKIKAWVVHRLDKEVSGVVLFAKSEEIVDAIKEKWNDTMKHYYALVEGIPEKPDGTIKSWLIEDKQQKVHSTTEKENAKFAVTSYKVIKKVNVYTLLDINIGTGRKNQIRVHLSDIGCPIVGDRKYGASAEYVRRIRLHAYSFSFPHPVTGRTVIVESPMPKEFLMVKEKDEKYK